MLTCPGKYLSLDYQNISLLLLKTEVHNFCVGEEQGKEPPTPETDILIDISVEVWKIAGLLKSG